MRTTLVLTVQATIDHKNEDAYEAKRDALIEKLEDGKATGVKLTVDVESEDED